MKKRIFCLLTAAAFVMPQLSGKADFSAVDSPEQESGTAGYAGNSLAEI